jgi:hypothetical protein
MTNTPVYRYFTADLITGEIVMEVPFSGVSWERKVNSAGGFSGSIAADEYTKAFDLYNTTLPGKHALYVMRNNVCVWGGIIWSRNYSITEKRLEVQAAEFVSYLYHRLFWKTITTDSNQPGEENSDDPTPVTGNTQTIKAFLETLINAVSTDQDDFEDDETAKAYGASDVHCRLIEYKNTTGTLATLASEEPHGFAVGDSVVVYINDVAVPAAYTGTFTVTATPSDREFSYVTASTTVQASYVDISATAATYAILEDTRDLLLSRADVRISLNVDNALADYVTVATGENNPFTFRGSEAKYVGEIIANFANAGVPSKPITANLNIDPEVSTRFDFTIESNFDTDTQAFFNVFRAWLVQKDINNPSLGIEAAKPLNELYGVSSSKTADSLIFEHPGNVASLTLEETAESAATRTWVVDSGNDLDGDAAKYYGAYTNIPYLEGANYPILEVAVTNRDIKVSGDEQVAPYAKQLAYSLAPPVGKINVTVNGSLQPEVGTYYPGDWCVIIPNDDFINERLRPPYENREGLIVRKIKSYRVNVPDFPTFPETVDLELVAEWEDE